MDINDPAMLLTFDGKLAYVGRCNDTREQYFVASYNMFKAYDTLASALLAAAKECGAIA